MLGLSLVRIGSHTQPPMNVSNEADKFLFPFADFNRAKSIFCFQYMQEKLCKECMHVLAIIKHQIQSQGFVTFESLLFLDTAYTKSILMFFTLGNKYTYPFIHF